MGAIETQVIAEEAAMCETHGEYRIRTIEVCGRRLRVGAMCPKCHAEKEAEQKAKAEAQEAEMARQRWAYRIGQAAIPERFHDRALATYVATSEGQRRALAFATAYADGFAASRGRGALFLGKPGTGKTHLAVGIALQVMQTGRSALFCTVMRAIRLVKDTWRRDADMTEGQAVKELVFPDLLILDEVGVQFGSEAEKLILFDVLNERYERRKATILLSNLTAPEVSAFLGERVMDRLREDGGQVVVFDWASHRGAGE